MSRLCVHSDDSYRAAGNGRHNIVTAGIALSADKSLVRAALLGIETTSGKGLMDWHTCRHYPDARASYISDALLIPALKGRVFFGFRSIPLRDHGAMRVDVLHAAVLRYSAGSTKYEIAHEGLSGNGREHLRQELIARGTRHLDVLRGDMTLHPEIRLADAIAGYVRALRFDDDAEALPDAPDWLVEVC